jgi:hypothetical protein
VSATVEFCGLPGAGKSRLVPEVETQLCASGFVTSIVTATASPGRTPAARGADKARLATRRLVGEPRLASVVLAAAVRDPQRRPQDRVRKIVNWLASQELVRASSVDDRLCLFDEGPIQALWSIGLWGDCRPLLERLTRAPEMSCVTDQLVVVRVEPETAERRLQRRQNPHSRLEGVLDPAERRQHLRRGAGLLDELVAWWEQETGRSATVIDGDQDEPASSGRSGGRSTVASDAIAASLPTGTRQRVQSRGGTS